MSGLAPIEPNGADQSVTFPSRDGWPLSGVLRRPDAGRAEPTAPPLGAVLVHGSHHERDTWVYGLSLPDVLAARGIASIRFDIRGRGESRAPRPWRALAPLERNAVADDVLAAAALLRDRAGISHGRLVLVGEQDTARHVVAAAATSDEVGALVLLSPRLDATSLGRLAARTLPTCALVSKEDRRSLRDSTAAYLAGADTGELHVFSGLGFGATMFMARAFEHADETPLQMIIADWIDRVL